MKSRAFTLIELLIVVLIIAILAAIAVPNFLEFQVRAKISRVKSDQRSAATAIEAYMVDNNEYPSSAVYAGISFFNANASNRHPRGWVASLGGNTSVTTPITYITKWPQMTFPILEPFISSTANTFFVSEVRGRPEIPMWYENTKNQSQPTNPSDSYRPGDKRVEFDLGMRWFVCTPGPESDNRCWCRQWRWLVLRTS